MSKWADRHGRLRFAPGALTDTEPHIDRIEIECPSAPLFGLPSRYRERLIEELGRGPLFRRRNRSTCDVRSRNWIMSGSLSTKPSASGEDGVRLNVVLKLNPTRFLQAHGVPHDWVARQQLLADPPTALRRQGRVAAALARAAHRTLNVQDNFITHDPVDHGIIRGWGARTSEYFEVVCAMLDVELTRVLNRIVGGNLMAPFALADWRVRQVEAYWEFKTTDAIQKMGAISRTARHVLRDSFQAEFPPKEGSDRNAPYVSGHLDHENIRAKLYAKTGDVVRFEVAYDKMLPSVQRRARRNVDVNGASVEAQLDAVQADATPRAMRFWNEFWRRHDAIGRLSSDDLIRFVGHLTWAAEGSQLSAGQLLSALILNDGGEPFEAGRRNRDPFKRLVERGVLSAPRGTPSRRVRYTVTKQCRPLVAGLRQLFDQVASPLDELHVDEDPPTARVRVRSIPMQPPPAPRRRNRSRP